MALTREDCAALDARDPLAHARARFRMPDHGIYLDGNSLGALPVTTPARIADVVTREWGQDLISSWNKNGWIEMPIRLGAMIAPLIGAQTNEVIVADSTSINLFKLAAAALRLNPSRKVIVAEAGSFPTDLYMMQGLAQMLGGDMELRLVAPEEIASALGPDVALLALVHSHYKTGALHDLAGLTRAAHAAGVLTLWDLSHSAGAVELALDKANCDFAVGCGYKYLNGGPGAPSFLYVARRHQKDLQPPLSGWMGHAEPFAFVDDYYPANGMARHLCGTPVVLGMAALEEGLKTFDGIAMEDVRAKSIALGDLFLAQAEERCAGHGFKIACPREGAARGSQVSLSHPSGYAIMQALIATGVTGDFRAPDVLRFGFAPLYTRYVDVWEAVERLAKVMEQAAWRDGRFQSVAAVT